MVRDVIFALLSVGRVEVIPVFLKINYDSIVIIDFGFCLRDNVMQTINVGIVNFNHDFIPVDRQRTTDNVLGEDC